MLAIGDDADQRVGHSLAHDALVDVANQAVRQRSVLQVAHRLEQLGHDLSQIPITSEAISAARLGVFLLRQDFSEAHSFAEIRRALVTHRRLLLSVIDELAVEHPGRFVLVYGLALSVEDPDRMQRESSDIDLYFQRPEDSQALVASFIARSGFEFAGSARGGGAGRDLTAWKLSGEIDGHAILVDGFVGGRPSSGHQWIPPFRLTEMFESASRVALPGGGVALIPSREHMLVMLAEKVQRKGDFSIRRVGDVLELTRTELDWDEIVRQCQKAHILLGLDWLSSQVESHRPGLIPADVLAAVSLPAWERKIQTYMHASTRRSTRLRSRSLHRRWWVARYVRDHSTSLQALIEVGSGRFVKPTRSGFHFEGPNQYGPRSTDAP